MKARPTALALLAFALAVTGAAAAAPLSIGSERVAIFRVAATVPLSSCTVGAAADAYVTESLTGAGSETELRISSAFLANERSFVRPDLGPCAIPAAARIKTAELRLSLTSAPSSSRTYDAFRITEAWDESVTWPTQPTVAASASASTATGATSDVTLAWNVLVDVAAFVAGTQTNNGWRISDRTESNLASIEGRVGAREHGTAAQSPALAITWYP